MSPASGPSLHLSWAELACHDRLRSTYPVDWRRNPTRAMALGQAFEDFRAECSMVVAEETNGAICDCPLIVLEGFRTEAYQAYLRSIPRYKAALHSQHCEGRAVDIARPRLLSWEQFVECIKRASARERSPIRYIELRPSMNYIHFDVRPTKSLVVQEIP